MEFEWDDKKAEANFRKHGVRFSEAVSVWLDGNSLETPDPEHSKMKSAGFASATHPMQECC